MQNIFFGIQRLIVKFHIKHYIYNHLSYFIVGYNSKEVSYVWKNSKASVDYETELKLSQFDIMQTEWRALNFSRGTLSMFINNNYLNHLMLVSIYFGFKILSTLHHILLCRRQVFGASGCHRASTSYRILFDPNLPTVYAIGKF